MTFSLLSPGDKLRHKVMQIDVFDRIYVFPPPSPRQSSRVFRNSIHTALSSVKTLRLSYWFCRCTEYISHTFLLSPVIYKCPIHLIVHDLIILIAGGKDDHALPILVLLPVNPSFSSRYSPQYSSSKNTASGNNLNNSVSKGYY